MRRLALRVVMSMAVALPLFAGTPEAFFRSIRAKVLSALGQFAAVKASVNTPDERGNTPLHYAALYGSPEAVRLLLTAGADVRATNAMGATALIFGASAPVKVRMLLAAGADANAATKAGRTALIIAAGRAGGIDAVRLLLAAGARVDTADQIGVTALENAAAGGDLATVRLLVEKGASVTVSDKAGFTPLHGAVAANDLVRVRLLLSKGADPNAANMFSGKVRHGNIALTKMTPLILAAAHGSSDMVSALLAGGGKVNVQDTRGMTPLMVAVAAQNRDLKVVRALLAAGADTNAADAYGDSVLDWARRTGHPEAVKLLAGAAGKPVAEPVAIRPVASELVSARAAVEHGIAVLSRSSAEFFRESGCVACHHQPMAARAIASATAAGIQAGSLKDELVKGMNATRAVEPALLQFIDPGGEVDSVANALIGFAAAGLPANSLTDAGVHYIAGKQKTDGSWTMYGVSRPPFEDSTITRTALAIRALRSYGWPARQTEFEERIARARTWLLKAEPRTSYERADLLLGLHWAGARPAELARVAALLIREQQPDGGWSQNGSLEPDAYATGLALHALNETGQLGASTPAYQRGVDFLLRTRLEDGSWLVRSRAAKFQPYFESGFPHGHDQWISATATAYAVMALAPAAQSTVVTAARQKP
jgi:ankyrin repeat protein